MGGVFELSIYRYETISNNEIIMYDDRNFTTAKEQYLNYYYYYNLTSSDYNKT